ncbi:MAG: hypothetical protein AAF458_01635 [Pseudomonadota bacterium]
MTPPLASLNASTRRNIWWIACTIALGTLLQSAWRPPTSLDAYWHLRMGHDWLFEGLSPWVDHHSFTFAGEAVTNPPYLFQGALALLAQWFGVEGGLAAWRTSTLMLAALAMMLWCRQVKAPLSVACISLAAVVLLAQFRNIARPELLSLTFSLVTLMLTRRAGLRFGWREVWPLALLFWIWCNYHAPVFGYIIAFGWFVDGAVDMLKRRAPPSAWRQWMLAGGAVTAVGFVNPQWYHPMLTVASYSAEWREHIEEYKVPLLHAKLSGTYVVLGIAALTLALIVRTRRFGYLIVWLILTYNALLVARLVTPAGIVIVAMFVDVASRAPLFTGWRGWSGRRQWLGLAAVVLAAGVPAASSVNLAYQYFDEHNRARQMYPGTYRYPTDVVDYMKDASITGRIFNVFETGGYLIWRGAPDLKVYIDGRTEILYPFEHFEHANRILQSAASLRAELNRYDIDLVLFDNSLETHAVVHQTGMMALDYAGTRYSLFRRGRGNLATLARLQARPACADAASLLAAREELEAAPQWIQDAAPLNGYLTLLNDYRAADDGAAFIAGLTPTGGWGDDSLRFTGYRALEHDQNELAYDLFLKLRKREPKDLMAGMLAKLRLENAEDAEALAELAAKTRWPRLQVDDVLLMRALLRAIGARRALSKVDETFTRALDAELARLGVEQRNVPLQVASFCALD